MKRLLLLSSILFFCGLLKSQSNFIKQDTVFAQSADCTGGVKMCIDSITYNNIGDYTFLLDGQPFSTTFDFCTEGSLHTYFYSNIFQGGYNGPFRLNSWSVDGKTFSLTSFANLNQLLDSMRTWDPTGGWQLEAASQLIFGFPRTGRTYSCQSISGSSPIPTDICYSEASVFNGLTFRVTPGFHQLIVNDTVLANKDTITLGAACIQKDTIRKSLGLNANDSYCLNTSGLLGQPQSASFSNFCSAATTHVTFDSLYNFCVGYTARTIGTDTACLRVCDQYGMCDTTYLYITADNSILRGGSYTVFDTVFVDDFGTKCNLTMPTGTINVFDNICADDSGTNVLFALDSMSKCISYKGLVRGTDTACVRVCNTLGTCDTTTFIVNVKPNLIVIPQGGTFVAVDTITTGLVREKCDFTAPEGVTIFENLCANNSGTNIQFTLNPTTKCVSYTGLTAGTDTACIRVCNTLGTCDTTYFYVRAKMPLGILPTPSTDTLDLTLFQTKTYCPDSSELAGSRLSLIKYCSPAVFNNVGIKLDTIKKCATITGENPGIDTFCLVICNLAGGCDTTTLYVRVSADTIKPTQNIESLSIKIGETKTYCPDSTELASGVITNIGSCTVTTVDNSSLTFNSVLKCAELKGISVGIDTICLRLCNSGGLCDTTTLYLRVTSDTLKPTPTLETLDVKLDETLVFIDIDTSEILGAVDTIFDACPGLNGTHALMILNRSARNVRITGLTLGQDKMCIVVCNRTTGLCDTTTLVINVVDTIGLADLIANNDFDTVSRGRFIDLVVYNNDSLRGRNPTSLVVTRQPIFGTADTFSFREGRIRYTAGSSPYSCGSDSFRYRFCVDTVCAEATVFIEIICPDTLKFYNAISPNKDERNDAFIIDGLQKYPNNTLLIFNRWGMEVLKSKNYENDWQGTWNGKDLPDGTYFFYLRNDDTGEVIQTGYLQILR